MLSELSYELRLRRAQREKRRLLQDYRKKRLAVGKGRDYRPELEAIKRDEEIDLMEANEEISYLTTTHLVEEAQRLILPIPSRDNGDFWYIDETFGRAHLTTEGVIKLRSEIRAERKARRELPLSLFPMVVGVIGALT